MAFVDDIQWSRATELNLRAADEAIERIARALEEDHDEQGARMSRDIGAVVIGCTGALCSAIADLSHTVANRPL